MSTGRPQRHGEAGATAIVMPDGFQYLAGAALPRAGDEGETPGHWLDPEGWWLGVASALSWLSAQVVEGFALSAAVTHSEFIWPLGDSDPADGMLGGPIEEVGTDRSRASVHAEQEVVTYLPLHGARQIQPTIGGAPVRRDTDADLSRVNLSSGSDPSWSQWTISILAALRSRVLHRREVTRMKTAWQAIDDRTLKDIGLSRYDVGLIVGDGHRRG
ncbi:MAG: hypothetical protein JO255_00985 [Alphaproteobacteria bacterium]|nr:hypothetical protein [Alphaproteobacteria bacterium]